MKVLFIYADLIDDNPSYKGTPSIALSYLAGYIKKGGHTTSLYHIFQPVSKTEFQARIVAEKADIVGFSSISLYAPQVDMWSKWAKEVTKMPIMFGGVHPSLVPKECIEMEGIDIVCVGEGEAPLLELCDKWRTETASLWFKHKTNTCSPLMDIEGIPYDYDLFDLSELEWAQPHMRHKTATVMASRGCPFNCFYCSNHALKKNYPNPEKYVRFQSVDKFITHMKTLKERYPFITDYTIIDDTFPLRKEWLREFSEKYKTNIHMPFRCQARSDIMDEETVDLLGEAGCYRIMFGLEHGNEYLLKHILNRPLDLPKMKSVFDRCREWGIYTSTYNMMGFPQETFRMTLDTIKANVAVGSDTQTVNIFYPLPGTKLYDMSKHMIKSHDNVFFKMNDTILDLEDMTRAELLFAYRFFRLFVLLYKKFPESLVDFLYLHPPLPRRLLNWIQVKFSKDFILTRQHKKFERRHNWI